MQKFPMTAEGLARLEEELKQLKSEERPAIIRAIAEARAHGDLSENAEYHAARERQSFIEGRIAELESVIPSVEVIDSKRLTGNQVRFGAYVTIVDEESDDEKNYRIVGQYEADMKNGSISVSSPLAKALMGSIPYYTTVAGMRAAVEAIAALRAGALEVAPLHSYVKTGF